MKNTIPGKLAKLRDEKAKSFTTNYVTMNNRPPHRPDVMSHCFDEGFDAACAEILPVVMALVDQLGISIEDLNRNFPGRLGAGLRTMAAVRELRKARTDAKEKLGIE